VNLTDRPSFLRTRACYFAMAVVAAAVTCTVLSCKKPAEFPKTRESPILVGDGSIKVDHEGIVFPLAPHILVITKASKALRLTGERPGPGPAGVMQTADLGAGWKLSSNATPDFDFYHTDYANGEAYSLYCPTDWTVTPGIKAQFVCKPSPNTKLTPVTLTVTNNGCPDHTNVCQFGRDGAKSDLKLEY
jgi:hypothetical protein